MPFSSKNSFIFFAGMAISLIAENGKWPGLQVHLSWPQTLHRPLNLILPVGMDYPTSSGSNSSHRPHAIYGV